MKPFFSGTIVESFCWLKRNYLFIYIKFYISQQAHGGNAATSGLGDLFDNLVNHLTVSHHNFLKHWDRLIDLEARASQVY
jgi:hypothetical protein